MRIVTGFHAVEEALRTGAGTNEGAKPKILYAKPGPRVKKILEDAKKRGVPARETTMSELDSLVVNLSLQGKDHRGLVLVMDGVKNVANAQVAFEEKLAECAQKQNSIVVLLDSITDPHNVGAIIRSCDQFGVDMVVVPEHNSAGDDDVIARTSAGASAWVPVATVTNLVRAAETLQQNGFWLYGADAGGKSAIQMSLNGKVALVMGSEGKGISRLLKEKCDAIVSIPTRGKLDSLNVSVATGILLYEIACHQN